MFPAKRYHASYGFTLLFTVLTDVLPVAVITRAGGTASTLTGIFKRESVDSGGTWWGQKPKIAKRHA